MQRDGTPGFPPSRLSSLPPRELENVLALVGVCLDGGPAPFLIMPFMANGSLLDYLKKNRETLVVSHEKKDDDEDVPVSL